MNRLAGKTAFVTGGACGIGRAICGAYLHEGAKVAIADISGADEAATELGDSAMAMRMDVTNLNSIIRGVSSVEDAWGGIDVLVNNAGVFDMAPIEEVTVEDYHRQYDVNVGATIFAIQTVVPGMKKRGNGGAIINFASQAGRRGEPNIVVYSSTKAAVISMTQSLALELAKEKLRVNAIAPGVIDTPMWDVVDGLFAKYENRPKGEKKRLVGEAVPLGYRGQPSDVAGPCVFLASEDANYMTARTLNVDGGNWMS